MSEPLKIDGFPDSIFSKTKTFHVEPTKGGYWCHVTGHRSADDLHKVPLTETIKWILEQISFGHFTGLRDKNGDVVSIRVGMESPIKGVSEEAVGSEVFKDLLASGLVEVVAKCRESGSYSKNSETEKKIWDAATDNMQRRMEIYYALVLAQLLGHVSKNCQSLNTFRFLIMLPTTPRNTLQKLPDVIC